MTGDLIVCLGFEYAEPVSAWASSYPNLTFVLVDTVVPETLPNLVSVVFAEDEAGFLAGVAAGVVTRAQVWLVYFLHYNNNMQYMIIAIFLLYIFITKCTHLVFDKRVGVLGGIEIPPVKRYFIYFSIRLFSSLLSFSYFPEFCKHACLLMCAFCRYVNGITGGVSQVCPTCKVLVEYIGSFTDEAMALPMCERMLAYGVDVIIRIFYIVFDIYMYVYNT